MRKTTDKKGHGLLGGAIVAALVVVFVLLILTILFQALDTVSPFIGGLGLGLFLFYIGAILAVGIGVVVALYQRWKEVEGGEEDEAKKY